MAKKRFRIDQGSSAGSGEAIKSLLSQFQGGDIGAAQDAIESGDVGQFKKLFDNPAFVGRFTDANKSALLNQFNQVQSQLPSSLDAQKGFIKSISDPANASNDDLQNLLEAHKGIGSTKPNVDWNIIADTVRQKLDTFGIPRDLADKAIPLITDSMQKLGGTFDPNSIWQAVSTLAHPATGPQYGNMPGVMDKLSAAINNGSVAADLTARTQSMVNAPDTSEDVKRIQGLIGDRANVTAQNAKVNDFLATAPGQLDAERTKFFDAQRNQAKDYITGEYAPQVAERLAARGLGDSGQVGASISSKYSDLLQGIDASQIDQLNQDTQFFQDQSYNKVFSDLVNARTDVGSTVANERQTLRTNQAQSFSKKQADIEANFNLDLFRQQSQKAYDTYNAQLQKRRQDQKSQGETGLAGQIGGLVGTAAGSFFGPPGALIGGAVGNAAGTGVGSVL